MSLAYEIDNTKPNSSQMQFYILVTCTVLILYLISWLQQNSRTWKMGMKIPGPVPLPLFGNALLALSFNNKAIFKRALDLGLIYGDVVRGFLGSRLFVFLTHPDDIEIILNSNTHLDKSTDYNFFKPWLGDGLLISSGEKWRSHRKLIATAFHQNVLKTFVSTFNENSLKTVVRLKKELGKEIDIHDYMSETTVDILLETAMGHPRTHDDKEGYNYAMAVMKLCDILHLRHRTFYYRFNALFNFSLLKAKQDKLISIIHGLTGKVFANKKKIFAQNMAEGNIPLPTFVDVINNNNTVPDVSSKADGLRDDLDDQDQYDVGIKRRLAFLDLMIESAYHGAELTDAEIKEEVDTIMFEGHDTTAAGSSFVLCLLGIHLDIQRLVFEEQQNIFGNSDRRATFNDTLEMKYLERVILETLRLYPPVPIIARRVNEDVKLVTNDIVIPAGATVVIGTFKTHRRFDLYYYADKFNPDNFLPERCQNRHYYGYIPFSAGPRSCVGRKYAMLKLKILLSTIIRNFKVTSDISEDDFQLQGDIILKRADGFRIKLENR
ncbi:cytochrome P450 4g15-like [Bradysia coprophila]|uniref:cytochrome P450 4g15-like n=1 Tax=Bradysia coprophila TaxID=38358 RepID=UPI00187D92AF|nr:cytochrome P450 4g15-like [Bradysia coprophila]